MNRRKRSGAPPRTERFFVEASLEMRRRTLCTSSISRRWIGKKDPAQKLYSALLCAITQVSCVNGGQLRVAKLLHPFGLLRSLLHKKIPSGA